MKNKVEQDNLRQFKMIQGIDKTNIQCISMTSIGLLDSFGKLIVTVELKDGNKSTFTFISPVPTNAILNYLKETNLIDITTLKKF